MLGLSPPKVKFLVTSLLKTQHELVVCCARSRILLGRLSNLSEIRTGGPAPRRGLGLGLRRKFLYFLYQNGELLCIPGDIY